MRARQQQQTTDSLDRLVSVFRCFGVSGTRGSGGSGEIIQSMDRWMDSWVVGRGGREGGTETD